MNTTSRSKAKAYAPIVQYANSVAAKWRDAGLDLADLPKPPPAQYIDRTWEEASQQEQLRVEYFITESRQATLERLFPGASIPAGLNANYMRAQRALDPSACEQAWAEILLAVAKDSYITEGKATLLREQAERAETTKKTQAERNADADRGAEQPTNVAGGSTSAHTYRSVRELDAAIERGDVKLQPGRKGAHYEVLSRGLPP